jgi:hypothetical protein
MERVGKWRYYITRTHLAVDAELRSVDGDAEARRFPGVLAPLVFNDRQKLFDSLARNALVAIHFEAAESVDSAVLRLVLLSDRSEVSDVVRNKHQAVLAAVSRYNRIRGIILHYVSAADNTVAGIPKQITDTVFNVVVGEEGNYRFFGGQAASDNQPRAASRSPG